jgi:N-methylhydantoinase B
VNLRGGGRAEWEVGGILGGLPGTRGEFVLNGRRLRSGKSISLLPGDRLVFRLEGGGGYGAPHKRARELVAKDIQSGLLSPESAHSIFGYGLPEASDTTDVAEVGVRST